MNSNPKKRTWIIYAGLLVVLLFLISSQILNNGSAAKSETLTTSDFIKAVENGEVTTVTFNAISGNVDGKYLKDGETDLAKATPFTSTYVGSEKLTELMNDHPETKYDISVQDPNFWTSILSYAIPILFFCIVAWFILTQINPAGSKQMQFGKAKAKKAVEERPKTKFGDVAGIDEAVEELQEVKDFLANPTKYQQLGAKIPRGVLLVGPPGTGKTLLARAVAGEAGVPFFSISGSDFVEMFVGVGASRVRDLFEKAKAAAPAIIFIDEIDAVGRQRGAGFGGGHDEREQTLNQLLVEMDGFEDNSSVILIAATNRVDILDPALLRPGRFDRQIVVMRPDLKGREQILRVHSAGKPLAHSVDLEKLARMTPGFTGADLANLMNEAALLTARKGKKLVTMSELDEAMEREIAGPERKGRVMTDNEKRTIAYHESGHALVGHILENSDPVHKISIISRGQALGYTLSLPSEDRFLNSRNEMFDDLAVFLGGRVAEEIFCSDITTGASNDLERATKMARQMVTRYGMTDALGTQVYGEANHEVFLGRDYGATPDYSEATAQRIDEEVAKIMSEAHNRAFTVLSERKEQIELMAEILLERETVEGEALEALLAGTWEEYIVGEDDLLARKAEELRKQEEDDERRRIEAQRMAEETARIQAQSNQGFGVPAFGTGGNPGNNPNGNTSGNASGNIGGNTYGNTSGNPSDNPNDQLKGNTYQTPNMSNEIDKLQPPTNDTMRYSLEDIYSGRVTPNDLFEAQRKSLMQPQDKDAQTGAQGESKNEPQSETSQSELAKKMPQEKLPEKSPEELQDLGKRGPEEKSVETLPLENATENPSKAEKNSNISDATPPSNCVSSEKDGNGQN